MEDQARNFDALLEALDVKDVVLVLHDWGSALGLDWARRHQDRVRGIVCSTAPLGLGRHYVQRTMPT